MGMWRTRRKHSDNGSETRQEKNSKPVKESPESVFDILNTKKRTEITQREPEPVLQVVKALHAFLPHPDRSFYDYYDKAEELGNGVTSVVYKCINRKSGKEYACKEMDKTKASPVQLQSIQSEVEIMLSIEDHAGVVGLNDIFEDDNKVYLVMDLCKGGELFHKIKKGAFSERDAARICRILISVISYCHTKNIMHRDLKPENVLMVSSESNSHVQLADFGHAVKFTPGLKLTELVGTPFYMAPEVVGKSYGPEADLWSLGIILYTVLAGTPPFMKDAQDTFKRLKSKEQIPYKPAIWSKISSGAKEVVQGLLQYNPEKRMTASEVKDHPWILEHCSRKPVVPVAVPVASEELYIAPRLARAANRPMSYEYIPVANSVPTASELPTALPVRTAVDAASTSSPLAPVRAEPGTPMRRASREREAVVVRGGHRRTPSKSSEDLQAIASVLNASPQRRSHRRMPSRSSEDLALQLASISSEILVSSKPSRQERRPMTKSLSMCEKPPSGESHVVSSTGGSGIRMNLPMSPNDSMSPNPPPIFLPKNRPKYYTDGFSMSQGKPNGGKSHLSSSKKSTDAVDDSNHHRRPRSHGESFWASFDASSMGITTPDREEYHFHGSEFNGGSGARPPRLERTTSGGLGGSGVRAQRTLSGKQNQSPLPKCVLGDVPPTLLAALHQKPAQHDSP